MLELRKIGVESFDAVFDIMQKSFPDDEYRDYEGQRELFSNPEYSIYVVDGEGGDDIKAFITVWDFGGFAYVEHFAVNPKYRNGGIGAQVLESLHELIGRQICLEVELPKNELARRRIGFYTRNGFTLNEYDYIQPPLAQGKNPVPLFIMTSREAIDEERFRLFRSVLYEKVYGCGSMEYIQ